MLIVDRKWQHFLKMVSRWAVVMNKLAKCRKQIAKCLKKEIQAAGFGTVPECRGTRYPESGK